MESVLQQQKKIESTQLCKFVYKDNFRNGKVVFECEAEDILEADKKYREATGLDPVRQPSIACSMLKAESIK